MNAYSLCGNYRAQIIKFVPVPIHSPDKNDVSLIAF